MFKLMLCYLAGATAFAIRMGVVSVGCSVLAGFLTHWATPDWRFWVIYGLIFLAYLCAAAVEYVADRAAKGQKEGKR